MRRHQFAVERPSILVVDDEQPILNAIARLLSRQGITVHQALSPDAAREKLKTIEVQIVCSDIRMEKENGISFLKWVREHHPKLQRILLTAHVSQPEYLTDAINQAGVHRFLSKPFDPPMLISTVKQSIEQWAIMAERDDLLAVTGRQNESLLLLNAELEHANADLESKVAERTRQIEEAAQMWRRTFDSIADPMTVVDERLRIRRANQAAADLADLDDVKMLVGRSCHDALFGRSEQCEGCPLGAKDEPAEWEDDRTGRQWAVSSWRLRDADDGRAWSVCRYHDVTEQRQMQHQVVRMERMAALGQMAGSVAHEINNPLTGILTFSQLVARGLERPDHKAMVDDIVAQARRCSDIVAQMLDFSRKGDRSSEAQPLDVGQFLQECERLATFQLPKAAAVELHFAPPPEMRPVLGNRVNLQSVVLNLITNAVQAMSHRGRIEVRAEPTSNGNRVRIHVTDNGPGVPEKIREQIFEPFFTTKAANRQGTGLGLAIVSDIVRDHRGTVKVENLTQGGARFTVELPTTVA